MKQPLTPDGVSAKLAEIYAMTTTNRLAEASAVESNFATWMGNNFSLTTAQSTFLSGINATAAAQFGSITGICFRNKLQISLSTPEPIDTCSKWIRSTNNILTSTNAAGEIEYTGSLAFEYQYRC